MEKKPPQKPSQRRPQGHRSNPKSSAGTSRNSNPNRAVPASRKKNIYRKSRYYRQRQKQLLLAGGAFLLLLLIILIFSVRSCISRTVPTGKEETASVSAKETKSGSETVEIKEPSPVEPVSLTVSVVGDCTLGTDETFDYSTSLNAYFDSYGKDYFFQNVKSIFQEDDLTIANMEGTLTERDTRAEKTFAFKAPASFAGILSSGSVEAVNMANNHSHDYGEESYSDTLSALAAEKITTFGYEETAVIDVKGVKVGLVGIYELNDHMERAQQVKDNIAKVKKEGAQLVIVIFHWGNEKETVPDENQMALGRLAIDEGADLVCGHHPHVLQGIETYKGKNIVYSLGNFCFGGNSAPSDMDTMIFQQTFTIDEKGVRADNVTNILPCSISSDYGYNNYQPTPAQGEEADRILQKIQERSSWIPAPSETGYEQNN